jgi:hypothetical protein
MVVPAATLAFASGAFFFSANCLIKLGESRTRQQWREDLLAHATEAMHEEAQHAPRWLPLISAATLHRDRSTRAMRGDEMPPEPMPSEAMDKKEDRFDPWCRPQRDPLSPSAIG